jgi:hypothetical protein
VNPATPTELSPDELPATELSAEAEGLTRKIIAITKVDGGDTCPAAHPVEPRFDKGIPFLSGLGPNFLLYFKIIFIRYSSNL